jgi:hypothetical protein
MGRGLRGGSFRPYSWFSRPEPLICLSSKSSNVVTRLSAPRSRLNIQKIWSHRESNPDLWICSQELWPLDHRCGRNAQSISFFSRGFQQIICHRPKADFFCKKYEELYLLKKSNYKVLQHMRRYSSMQWVKVSRISSITLYYAMKTCGGVKV